LKDREEKNGIRGERLEIRRCEKIVKRQQRKESTLRGNTDGGSLGELPRKVTSRLLSMETVTKKLYYYGRRSREG